MKVYSVETCQGVGQSPILVLVLSDKTKAEDLAQHAAGEKHRKVSTNSSIIYINSEKSGVYGRVIEWEV